MYVSVDIQVWDKNSYWIAYKHSHILYAYKVILYIIYHMKKLFHTELTHTHIWKHTKKGWKNIHQKVKSSFPLDWDQKYFHIILLMLSITNMYCFWN